MTSHTLTVPHLKEYQLHLSGNDTLSDEATIKIVSASLRKRCLGIGLHAKVVNSFL